jgi:hypothetical protein
MRGANLRFLRFAALVCLAAGTAQAAPPARSPDEQAPLPRLPRHIQEIQSIGADPHLTTFAGMVLNVEEKPVAGVTVQLFIAGERAGTAVTSPDGYYELRAHYDYREDQTSILWYVPPDRTLLTKALVLSESRTSQEQRLISPCVPRAKITPGHQFRVYLFDSANRNKELEETGCLP